MTVWNLKYKSNLDEFIQLSIENYSRINAFKLTIQKSVTTAFYLNASILSILKTSALVIVCSVAEYCVPVLGRSVSCKKIDVQLKQTKYESY